MQNSEGLFFFSLLRWNMQFGEIADMCLIMEKYESVQNL